MKIANYLKETKGEMKHVTWPSRKQVIVFTTTVILLSLAVALFLGVFDFLFSEFLKRFIL